MREPPRVASCMCAEKRVREEPTKGPTTHTIRTMAARLFVAAYDRNGYGCAWAQLDVPLLSTAFGKLTCTRSRPCRWFLQERICPSTNGAHAQALVTISVKHVCRGKKGDGASVSRAPGTGWSAKKMGRGWRMGKSTPGFYPRPCERGRKKERKGKKSLGVAGQPGVGSASRTPVLPMGGMRRAAEKPIAALVIPSPGGPPTDSLCPSAACFCVGLPRIAPRCM